MNILIVTHRFFRDSDGRTEALAYALSATLVQRGHNVRRSATAVWIGDSPLEAHRADVVLHVLESLDCLLLRTQWLDTHPILVTYPLILGLPVLCLRLMLRFVTADRPDEWLEALRVAANAHTTRRIDLESPRDHREIDTDVMWTCSKHCTRATEEETLRQ
jgi:hypothetical protein